MRPVFTALIFCSTVFSPVFGQKKAGFFHGFGAEITGSVLAIGSTDRQTDNFGNQFPRENWVLLNTNIAFALCDRIRLGYARKHTWEQIKPGPWEYYPLNGGFGQFHFMPHQPRLNVWLEAGFYVGKFETRDLKTVRTTTAKKYYNLGVGVEYKLKGNLFLNLLWLSQDSVHRKFWRLTGNHEMPPVAGISYHVFLKKTAKSGRG